MLKGLERLEYLVDAYIRRATTLLDISRINTGHLQLAKTEIDLSSLVRETVSAMIPAATSGGMRDLSCRAGWRVRKLRQDRA